MKLPLISRKQRKMLVVIWAISILMEPISLWVFDSISLFMICVISSFICVVFGCCGEKDERSKTFGDIMGMFEKAVKEDAFVVMKYEFDGICEEDEV